MELRSLTLIDTETHREGRLAVGPPTRQVAACAVVRNPLAGSAGDCDLAPLVDLSVEVGTVLTARALGALGDGVRPRAYSKGVVVGSRGTLEHGAAMIHVRIGLAMRQALGRGRALIPGTAKVGGPGTSIDLLFGGIDDAWDYDAMDAMEIIVPGAPEPDEVLLIVAFATGRAGARIQGASQEAVEALVQGFASP